MITVRTSGYLNSALPKDYQLVDGETTISCLAVKMKIDPEKCTWSIDGQSAGPSSDLYDGATVAYAMRNIKGA